MTPTTVAISGFSSNAGKTTLACELLRAFPGWEAIKTSYRAVLKNLGGIVGLILLNVGLGIVGFLCCFVGVYFVLPVTYAAYAAAYRQVFPESPMSFASSPPPPPASWAA